MESLGLRSAALPRGGYAFRSGFPLYPSQLYNARALRHGLTIVYVRQVSAPLNRCPTPRLPCFLLIPSLSV